MRFVYLPSRNFSDIDECQQFSNAGCSDQCHNSNGSFSCGCEPNQFLFTQTEAEKFPDLPNMKLNRTCFRKRCAELPKATGL